MAPNVVAAAADDRDRPAASTLTGRSIPARRKALHPMIRQLRRLPGLVALVSVALLAAACSGSDDADADAVPATDPVTLLDAGQEPRVELRLAIDGPVTENVAFTQIQEVIQLVDGEPAPSAGPLETITELRITTTPNDDGTFTVVTEVIGAELGPTAPSETSLLVEGALADLVGTRSEVQVSDRGVPLAGSLADVVDGQVAGQVLSELAEQATNPYPAEPVGVGARWQVSSVIEVTGVDVEQLTEFTVVAIDGDRIEVTTTVEQFVAADAGMELADGVVAEITDWSFTGTGSATLNLGRAAPASSASVSEGTQSFNVDDVVTVEQRITSLTAIASS